MTLTAEERQGLHDLIAAGKAAAQKLAHARILLKADAAGGPAWTDHRIAEALEVGTATLERVGSGSSSRGSTPPWSAGPRGGPAANRPSTAGPKLGSSP